MVTMMMLAVAVAAQDPSIGHVRTNTAKIASLISTGLAQSATFHRLVDTLDQSDVIVYVDPKLTRQALGGYLAHNIVSAGRSRYLHIAVEIQGATGRLIPLLAHELQHALEVARDPTARDAQSVERLFSRLAISFGCGGTTCSETQAAKDVEASVGAELKLARFAGLKPSS